MFIIISSRRFWCRLGHVADLFTLFTSCLFFPGLILTLEYYKCRRLCGVYHAKRNTRLWLVRLRIFLNRHFLAAFNCIECLDNFDVSEDRTAVDDGIADISRCLEQVLSLP
jgi:hypothetical protein